MSGRELGQTDGTTPTPRVWEILDKRTRRTYSGLCVKKTCGLQVKMHAQAEINFFVFLFHQSPSKILGAKCLSAVSAWRRQLVLITVWFTVCKRVDMGVDVLCSKYPWEYHTTHFFVHWKVTSATIPIRQVRTSSSKQDLHRNNHWDSLDNRVLRPCLVCPSGMCQELFLLRDHLAVESDSSTPDRRR